MLRNGIILKFKVILILGATLCNTPTVRCECPDTDDWKKIGHNCVKEFEDHRGWINATEICKEKSGNLVSIFDEDSQKNLLEIVEDGSYWIGGHIPALVFKSYFNRCPDGFGFRNSSCFQIQPEYLTWEEAGNICGQFGGKLAMVLDEETNVFLGNAMEEMARQRNLTGEGPSLLSYWIDGQSSDGSVDFYDVDGNILEYTNMALPVGQRGKRCLEVSIRKATENKLKAPPSDLEKMEQELEDEVMKESIESLPTGLPPGILPQNDDDDPEEDNKKEMDTKMSAPRYNALGCDEKRLAVCQFSLNIVESPHNSSSEDENDEMEQPTILPSRVESCKHLALLSMYSDRSCSMDGYRTYPYNAMSDYVALKNSYYIFKKHDSPSSIKAEQTENSTVERNYELKWCEVENLKTTLPDEPSYSKQHFKWVQPNNVEDQSIVKLGFLGDEDLYNGPCITISPTGNWNTSRCGENYRFLCEFSQEAIKEHFCESDSNESWCGGSGDNLNQLNAESTELLEELRLGSHEYTMNGSPGARRLSNLTKRANLLPKYISSTMKTRRGIENFTSSILRSAAILLDPNLCYFDDSREHIRSIVTSLNTVAEYSADLLTHIWMNRVDDNNSDAAPLTLNASGLHLQVAMLDGNTTNGTLFNHSKFLSTNSASMTMMLTDDQVKAVEAHGATIINLHYEILGSEKYTPRSLSAITEMQDYNPVTYPTRKEFYMMGSDVQTATLRINGTNVPTNVKFTMNKNALITDLEKVEESEMCAFLQQDAEIAEPGLRWSTEGCRMLYDNGSQKYHCECNHTTDFAVLLLVFEPIDDFLDGHRDVLSVLTAAGHILSLICLLISIVLFVTLKRDIKSDRRLIHVNLFFALFLANVVLLISQITSRTGMVIGIDDETGDRTYAPCFVLTFFNHLLLLTSLFWMLTEGIVIYRKIVVVLSCQRKAFSKAYYAVGWGIPLIISIATVAIGALTDTEYHSEGCWLSVSSGMIWAFAGPAILVILVNFVILILVLRVAMRTQKRKVARRADAKESDKSKLTTLAYLQTAARGLVVLTPLLGLTWMIGLLMFHVSVAYIFVMFNAFQGVAIFICYCVCNPEIRAALDMKWKHYKARHFTPMHEEKPLATDSSDGKQSRWMKSKLLMRLSFSTTPSKPHDKFNSMQNSDMIDEKEEDDQNFRGEMPIHEKTDRRTESRSSSSQVSHASSSCTSVTHDSSRKLNRKKLTAKITPLDTTQQSTKTRPSTTDVILDRESQKEHCHGKRRTRKYSESYYNAEAKRENESMFDNDRSQQLTNSNADRAQCFGSGDFDREGAFDNEAMESDSDSSEYNTNTGDIPKPHLTAITRKPIVGKCDLCSRDYYNAFDNDVPVRLYSNNYTRRNKRKQHIGDEVTKNTTRRDSCTPRCCPGHPPDQQRAPVVITIYGTQKQSLTNKQSLDVIEIGSRGRHRGSSHRRPSSGISKDSGILPDDIEDYENTDPI